MPRDGDVLDVLQPPAVRLAQHRLQDRVLQALTLPQVSSLVNMYSTYVGVQHRRRMETEAKAKVVASVWGAKFIKFFAALAILPWSIVKDKD